MTATRVTFQAAISKRIEARRCDRQERGHGCELGRGVIALALAAFFPVACGGRSVRHVEAGADESQLDGSDGQLGANELDACESVCLTCFAEDRSCADDCAEVLPEAQTAACAAALDALLACRIDILSCDSSACARENNDLSVCVIRYCERQPSAALCTTPL